jgi:pyochelin biosynthetic protein PchC
MTHASDWIRRYHPASPTAPVVVCLPHAGGSASFYFPLSRALAPELDVALIQYPGRQERRAERPISDLDRLADRLFDVVAPLGDRPVTLFGHSMGALLAYELACRLEDAGIGPRALVVSGRRAPSRHRDERVHTYSDERLLAEIRMLSGTDAGLLDDAEVVRMVLPALRADYRAVERHRYRPRPPLAVPILALTGDADPRVDVEEARAWAEHTCDHFELRVFPGGHFYLVEHQDAVITAIRDATAVPTR